MKVLTLDIETVPSEPYNEVDTIPQAVSTVAYTNICSEMRWETKPKFPPLPLHEPVVICWLVASNHPESMKIPSFLMNIYDSEGLVVNEAQALETLSKDLQQADRLVTWNGRGFDMPLLNLRALKYGVDWRFWDKKRHRFPNYRNPLFHYDMMDQLGDYGAARSLSLDRVAKLIGLPGKVGIDGSQVARAIEDGRRREVIAYCCNDVFETYMIYLAFAHSHLGSKGEKVQAQINAAREWAKEHEYLKEFYK